MATISKEDVIDAIDEESENRLEMLTEYWQSCLEEVDATDPKQLVAQSLMCAKIPFAAKAYQDTLDWLDAIGLEIAKIHGEESEHYVMFIENDDLENMRMVALDKSSIEVEDEDDDFGEDE